MSDGKPCGRPLYSAPEGVDETPVCLMHSKDSEKDAGEFEREIKAILDGTSECHRGKHFDFAGFVFLTYDFSNVTFGQGASFTRAEFGEGADFTKAKFGEGADFEVAKFGEGASFTVAKFGEGASFFRAKFGEGANFTRAEFGEGASFFRAEFGEGADFEVAKFGGKADFSETIFQGVASFQRVTFENPAQVTFHRVNHTHQDGFLVRFLNCDMREVVFEDVHWHRLNGRMALQDELDVTEPEANKGKNKEEEIAEPESRYELAAIAYRRLINNFEKVRAYDLAEDCFIGAMEMKRLDPKVSFPQRFVTTLYRWASHYGSSYTRALCALGLMFVVFSAIFLFTGFKEVNLESTPIEYNLFQDSVYRPAPVGKIAQDYGKALVQTLSIVTFQRTRYYEPVGAWSQFWVNVATLFMTTQMALIILALRRRFKR